MPLLITSEKFSGENKMDEELFHVLNSKEERWQKRLEISQKERKTLISITLCLPLKYRTDQKYKELFLEFCNIYTKYCEENGVKLKSTQGLDGFDGPCIFYLSDSNAIEVKKISSKFEESEKPFRIMDIDIMDENQNPIGREEIGLPPRKCFICNNSSAACVKAKTHSKADLEKKIKEYFLEGKEIIKNVNIFSKKY